MAFDPKKLGEEADDMIKNLNQLDDKDAAEDQVETESETIAQADEAQADDQGVEETPAQPTEDVAEVANNELDDIKSQLAAAEQRWKVLQGMINKKDDEIEAMRGLLAEMAQQKPAQEASQESPAKVEELITKDDIDEYGPEIIDLISRASTMAARQEMSSVVAQLAARIDKLEGSMQGVAQTTAATTHSLFESELSKLVPNWATLNTDPSFLEWLEVSDPFTGAKRLDLLQSAASNSDAARVANFFKAYLSENTQVASESVSAPTNNPKEKLVAPGKTKVATPTQEGKRTWTRAEIAKVYDDKMAGRISAKEFDKLERDIFAAQHEGRVAA